ncbi:hypothetical protein MKX03_006155 [Papaver bracteatum]|nr:hypothetical protein MKX03_006155 [Papaver bracteatum]
MAEENQKVVMKEKDDVAEMTEKSSEPFDALPAEQDHARKQFSQYTCPSCNLRYCSLQCYKEPIEDMDHSDNDDNDYHTLSEEIMQKILSGIKLIKPWDPWWFNLSAKTISFSREGTQLVKPLHQQDDMALPLQDTPEGGQSSEVPPGPENPLPSINKLSSTNPSPLFYCFTLRLYNGDWKSDAFDAAVVSVTEALAHSLKQTCSASYKHAGGLRFGVGLINDVVTLLHLGRNALVCALCDQQRLIQAGGHELRSGNLRKLKKSEMKTKLKLVDRKIYFMMCWVYGQPNEAWTSLATLGGKSKPININGEQESKNKVFIEEVK